MTVATRRPTRTGPLAGAVTSLALATVAAAPAHAVEREHHIGFDLGTSMLVVSGHGTDTGVGLGGHWAYGLNDVFNVMVEGGGSIVAFDARPSWTANVNAGLSYVLDVMQWVPYIGLLAGGYVLSGHRFDRTKVLPGAVLALGLDYRLRPDLAVGVAVREHMLVTEASTYPSFIQVLVRVEYTWGW